MGLPSGPDRGVEIQASEGTLLVFSEAKDGTAEAGGPVPADIRPTRLLRIVSLPGCVVQHEAAAEIREGILEVTLPQQPALETPTTPRASHDPGTPDSP